jgi:hypothetical protein
MDQSWTHIYTRTGFIDNAMFKTHDEPYMAAIIFGGGRSEKTPE